MKKVFLLLFLSLIVLPLNVSLTQAQTAPANDSPEALKQRIEQLQKRMSDWPQLNRYREANAQIKPPAKGEARIVFMGDSITDGWRLAEYFPDKPYINRGIGGQTTPQMLIRFRPDVVDLAPSVVVILAGTNDLSGNTGPMTLAETENNIASMAELARANNIRVVLSSVLPIHDYGKNKISTGRPPDKILALNQWIKVYCKANGHTYLDYFSQMVDDKGMLKAELAEDGLHPNKAGYEIMKPLADEAIKEALKKKR